jgi:hypothetical protein
MLNVKDNWKVFQYSKSIQNSVKRQVFKISKENFQERSQRKNNFKIVLKKISL